MRSKDHRVRALQSFPEIKTADFSPSSYDTQFGSTLIVKARSKKISYDPHWGALSIKCAFNGVEYYDQRGCRFAVSDKNFMVFNNGSKRSSFIDSPNEVDSFTISFSPNLESEFVPSILKSHEVNLDDPKAPNGGSFRFTEKLYAYRDDYLLSSLLMNLYSSLPNLDEASLFESTVGILERLVWLQSKTNSEIQSLKYVRHSTRKEIYERLYRSRDFIISNFRNDLSLECMSSVACMNSFYFLREFKRHFRITPYRFLQKIRLEEARSQLQTSTKTVTEVCRDVGFSDLASFSRLYKRTYNFNPSAH